MVLVEAVVVGGQDLSVPEDWAVAVLVVRLMVWLEAPVRPTLVAAAVVAVAVAQTVALVAQE